jgi:hypothetical protein
MRVRDLVNKKKNLLLFFEGKIFPEKSIATQSSWSETKDFLAKRNMERCRQWCKKENKCNLKFKVIAA